MLDAISKETIEAIFDAIPLDLTYIDDTETVRYFSKGEKRIFPRPPGVIGRQVSQCHPEKSLGKVEQVISELRNGQREVAEFWIDIKGRKIYIRYFPVRDKQGKFLGIIEATMDITDIQKITGQKRLLD